MIASAKGYFSFSRTALARFARGSPRLASLSSTPMFSKRTKNKKKTTSVYRLKSFEPPLGIFSGSVFPTMNCFQELFLVVLQLFHLSFNFFESYCFSKLWWSKSCKTRVIKIVNSKSTSALNNLLFWGSIIPMFTPESKPFLVSC